MTIKIYKEADRVILEDIDNDETLNYPLGSVWFRAVGLEMQLLSGQTILFNGRTFDELQDKAGNIYNTMGPVMEYLSDTMFTPPEGQPYIELSFDLPTGVGGTFVLQEAQAKGQYLEMAVMTYETGTVFNLYGARTYGILTTPTAVSGFQIESSVNSNNTANITGIFKNGAGELSITVNGAPWPISTTIRLYVRDEIEA